jgi:arylsulfatase A-like enzyme
MIVRWPDKIPAAQTSDLPWAFWDALPTVAELCHVPAPSDIDGLSIVPTLLGSEAAGREQPQHEYLYWEFHEKGFHQAIRFGRWKAIRDGLDGPIALYDLREDLGETNNLAKSHPKIVARAAALLAAARTESERFPITTARPQAKRPNKDH